MRFERTTFRVGVWHSIQLSYGHIFSLSIISGIYGFCKGKQEKQKNIQKEDIITRLGGDEFCILFKEGSEEFINNKMNTINEEFSKQATDYPQSFSYGTIYIDGNEDTSLLKILQMADQRMYTLKRKRKMTT